MSNKQLGSSIVEGGIAIVAIAVLGFVGWTIYNTYTNKPVTKSNNQSAKSQTSASNNTKSNPYSQQNAADTNLLTDYFAPANISFSHDKKWSWDTTGETYGYAGHPNEKAAVLTLPYQGASDTLPSRYTIGFTSDSYPPTSEPDLTTFTKLGQVTLDNQTLYILKAYYDANVDAQLDKIITSSCPDKECGFQLSTTTLYFYVSVTKGTQNSVPLDDSMVPEITTILESMQLGKQ